MVHETAAQLNTAGTALQNMMNPAALYGLFELDSGYERDTATPWLAGTHGYQWQH